MKQKVYLTLENGRVFEGYRFGAEGDAIGELVFTTGMVGYDKVLTDPAFYGQIVVQTFPLIGNYGIIQSELEGKKAFVSAYVVREACDAPSNFRTEGTLDEYLKQEGIVGVYGVDTRELTRVLRTEGTMNAVISSKPCKAKTKISAFVLKNAVEAVSPQETTVYGEANAKKTIAFWDFGAKESAVRYWVEQGMKVIRVPATTSAQEILSLGVDGVIISEGPGNPNENVAAIAEIKELLGKKPIFAIGLGMQMLAIVRGAMVEKMNYGHRGGNQPVKFYETQRVYASTQNHGYEVGAFPTGESAEVLCYNVNDGGLEGFTVLHERAIALQFDPSACSAALEENFLVKKFIEMMK